MRDAVGAGGERRAVRERVRRVAEVDRHDRAVRDREVFGSGGCGKGHKEWVKVADGGPYLKTKARLG